MRICVLGLWHLGSVTAACLAAAGHRVVGLELNESVAADLARGQAPVREPGLDALLATGLRSGALAFSSSLEPLRSADVLWVAHDTPVDAQDRPDTAAVLAEIEQALAAATPQTLVIISSQLPVGSVRRLEVWAAAHCPNGAPRIACVPENLRLGQAVEDFLHPARIVVGVRQDADRAALGALLSPFCGSIEWMSVESAEMTKHAINALFATTVAFVNEIAAICEAVGADAKDVGRGLKSEPRIGARPYLEPGAGFSGGTLARDVASLNEAAGRLRVATPLLSAVLPSNELQRAWTRNKLSALLGDLSNATVAIWGLTYKPGTDTLRRSAAADLCDWLIGAGAAVRVHDPAVGVLPMRWADAVRRYDDPLAAARGSQALVVATPWPLYRTLDIESLRDGVAGLAVLDPGRFLPELAVAAGPRYFAVGAPGGTS
jgi:UDPglucose 6-dehydrogenase